MISSWLRHLPRPVCRLTNADAIGTARTALGTTMPMVVLDIVQAAAGIEWQVGTATVGSGTVVHIDDASGLATAINTWGRR